MDDSSLDPWQGANADKRRHPRLGKFVDNIWVLLFNRIVGSVAPAVIVAVLGWGVAKLNAFNDIVNKFPTLASDVRDISKQLRDQNMAQDRILDNLKGAQTDIESLKAEVAEEHKAIADTNTDAAASRARVDDMKEELSRIEALASQNLAVSRSHDADIKATRQAVDPTNPP